MLLSIIVPIYNVEQYIYKCISSIVNQNVSSELYEIIVVNDGTKDNSINIIKNNFPSAGIIFIDQENQGLSEARNNGLKISKGEYVWFIDSDDWIENNALKDILPLLHNFDILSFLSYYSNGKEEEITNIEMQSLSSNGDYICCNRFYHQAQLYIYKKHYLIDKKLHFCQGIYHEDSEFTPRALYQATNVYFYPKPVYHYLLRENSITTTTSAKRCYDLKHVISNLYYFSENSVMGIDRFGFKSIIADLICSLLEQNMDLNNNKVSADVNLFLRNTNIRNCLKCSSKRTIRILGVFSDLFPSNVTSVYSILYKFKKKRNN